jgi:hypothetical protein
MRELLSKSKLVFEISYPYLKLFLFIYLFIIYDENKQIYLFILNNYCTKFSTIHIYILL